MFVVKLLANSVVASNCYIVLNILDSVFTLHISHAIWGIIIIDHC